MKKTWHFLGAMVLLAISNPSHLFAQHTIELQVQLPAVLVADAGPDQTIDPGSSVTIGGIVPASGGTLDYHFIWAPSESLDNAYLSNPVASPEITTAYTLTLFDDRNCYASDEVTVTVSGTGLENPLIPTTCHVFPNPSNGLFNLRIFQTGKKQDVSVRIISAQGKVVYVVALDQEKLTDPILVDLNKEPAGIYILQISDDRSQVIHKLIIE